LALKNKIKNPMGPLGRGCTSGKLMLTMLLSRQFQTASSQQPTQPKLGRRAWATDPLKQILSLFFSFYFIGLNTFLILEF